MVDTTDTGRSAIGGTSAIGAQQQGNTTFSITPDKAVELIQGSLGSEFVLIQRQRQSEPPLVYSSGDPTQTQDLFRQAYTHMAFDARSGQDQRQPTTA